MNGKKKGRFQLPASFPSYVSMLIGLIGAIYGAYVWYVNRDSETRLLAVSSDENHVFIKVSNTGGKPSRLLGYRLRFADLPNKEFMLDLSADDNTKLSNVITAGSIQRIALTDPQEIPDSRKSLQYTLNERKRFAGMALSQISMTLEVDVREYNDPNDGSKQRTLRDSFKADIYNV